MPPSDRSSTSGSRTARSRSKSPSRAAARNASTTAHWPSRSTSGTGAPWTRRRPRLASWRVAVGVRPTIGAISSNGTANTSCSTNATRSAGASESSTTSNASPTESPSRASCSGSMPASGLTIGIRHVGLEGRLAPRPARPEHVEADPPDDRRQPGPQVLDLAGVGAAQADPRLLDGVVGLADRAEHPECHAAQVGAVGLEAIGEPVLVVHAVTFLRLVGSSP